MAPHKPALSLLIGLGRDKHDNSAEEEKSESAKDESSEENELARTLLDAIKDDDEIAVGSALRAIVVDVIGDSEESDKE